MMKINFFIILLLLASCSQNTIDWLTAEKNTFPNLNSYDLINKNNIACTENNLRLLISLDDSKNNFDKILTNTIFYYYSNIEKALALSLIELIRRPDLNSPQSSFQVYFGDTKNLHYYSFSNKNPDGLPVIYGIDYLLKKYSKNKNLKTFVQEIEKIIPENLYVDRGLENFILENKKNIQLSPILSTIFLRGDEPLTRFETFKRANLNELIKLYLQDNKYNSPDNYNLKLNQFDYEQNQANVSTKCNFNVLSDQEPVNTDIAINDKINYIGIANKQEAYISTFFSLKKSQLELINKLLFFKTTTPIIELPVCQISNPSNQLNMILSSIDGRSKNQHLKHLIEYEIFNATDDKQLHDILNFPRHLFLTSPDRILYESKKGRESQLNFFLSMNFPIYHVEKLGNVIGISKMQNKLEYNFVQDIRNNNKTICTK